MQPAWLVVCHWSCDSENGCKRDTSVFVSPRSGLASLAATPLTPKVETITQPILRQADSGLPRLAGDGQGFVNCVPGRYGFTGGAAVTPTSNTCAPSAGYDEAVVGGRPKVRAGGTQGLQTGRRQVIQGAQAPTQRARKVASSATKSSRIGGQSLNGTGAGLSSA